jgi:bifunctional DNA-binding transcriptional regulator/antitoxin component of YhaV-PrlF toxin-antitoxin module
MSNSVKKNVVNTKSTKRIDLGTKKKTSKPVNQPKDKDLIVEINSRYSILIPVHLRELLGLKVGTKLEIEINPDGILFRIPNQKEKKTGAKHLEELKAEGLVGFLDIGDLTTEEYVAKIDAEAFQG